MEDAGGVRQRHVHSRDCPAAHAGPADSAASAEKDARDDADGGGASTTSTPFDCNICLDMPNDPVVTACGHLYCWQCLYRWMRLHAEAPQCPVCKSSVDRKHVTPIYGRGRSSAADPRLSTPASGAGDVLPPRPVGHRVAPAPPLAAPPFGFHPAAFGRVNAYGTYGFFPSIFGMQVAYPQVNDPPRDVPDLTPQLTPEEETQEQVIRVFLFLAFFIACSVSFF